MTLRQILMALMVMLLLSIAAASALVLYARSDAGRSALERLERSPDWRGIGDYRPPR
ncbi:hypothetical protein [Azospirillum sp. ST 5-10]|uniref:hypothetical protein n=1 Tax=unclassified Azospirillum TaxID=2630922 RepID=UPI003F4A624D